METKEQSKIQKPCDAVLRVDGRGDPRAHRCGVGIR